MNIIVEVTHEELSKLGMDKDRLGVIINRALDQTTLLNGQPANLNVYAEVKLISA